MFAHVFVCRSEWVLGYNCLMLPPEPVNVEHHPVKTIVFSLGQVLHGQITDKETAGKIND